MTYRDFTVEEHGFAGHMAEPQQPTDKAVIVIMGGEKSILPGIHLAERFADFGIVGLSVSLFGAEGLPDDVDRIPLELFGRAVDVLHQMGIRSISTYGISMGSIFALLTAVYIGGIDNVVLCSPSHVPFEATAKDKKHTLGHSIVTFEGKELPFVRQDFSRGSMMKYEYNADAKRKVTRMWSAFNAAYHNRELEQKADIHPEKANARILLIAGTGDESWPSEYSVNYLKNLLDERNYEKEYKTVVYPGASHLIGVMPSKKRSKWLYRLLPLIGLLYHSLNENRAACIKALESSEKEVIAWIKKG